MPTTTDAAVAQLVRAHAVDNTIVLTFSNDRQRHITENWVYHLQQLSVGGLLVGMMNMQPEQPTYVALAKTLRAQGVGVYTVNSREVRIQPQGGRWFHVLPLLRTGCRVLLSDSDAVWLRNPLPYLRALDSATHGSILPSPPTRRMAPTASASAARVAAASGAGVAAAGAAGGIVLAAGAAPAPTARLSCRRRRSPTSSPASLTLRTTGSAGSR